VGELVMSKFEDVHSRALHNCVEAQSTDGCSNELSEKRSDETDAQITWFPNRWLSRGGQKKVRSAVHIQVTG
jgi:hypothetical protein